jgi:beta-N-acetylhexosaminidase
MTTTSPARSLRGLVTSLVTVSALVGGCSAFDAPSATPEQDGSGAMSSKSPKPPKPPKPSRVHSAPDSAAAGSRAQATAPVAGGWGPTGPQLERARRAVARMSLRELAGQVIVARYGGTRAPTGLVRRYHLGGVIVMEDNVGSIASVRRSNQRLQRSDDRPWPLLVGVDQEGGIVARLGAPMTKFPTLMTYGAARRPELARRSAHASGEELRAAGFTMVFAPDADVTIGSGDPTIGSRSVGSRPRQVARNVTALLKGYREAGIEPVVKHFPGHGSVGTDSHLDLPLQDASMRTLRRRDLVPFRAAVKAGAPAAMIAHLDVRAVDPGTPSTLSRPVVTGLLRKRMGFNGLVVTDALEMGAIVDGYGTGGATVRALRAGVDVALMPADLPVAHRSIVSAVRSGRLSRSRLEQAATRVVALMMHQASTGAAPPPRVIGSHDRASYQASKAGITVVSGPCSGRLVGRGVRVSGDPAAASAFRRAARKRGLSTSGGTSVVLLDYGASAARGDVVVSTDTPYVLGQSRARTRIAAFGDTPGAMRALVEVLLGRARGTGELPVPVRGVPRRGC